MSEEEKEVLKTFKSGLGLTSAEREILVNYIDKLQTKCENQKRINLEQNQFIDSLKTNIIKLQKEIDKIREVEMEVIKENTCLGKKVDEQARMIDKLQKENKNADERNYSLGLGFIQIGEKLGLENFGIQTILLGIEKLQKENEELKEKIHEKNMRIIKLNKLLGE